MLKAFCGSSECLPLPLRCIVMRLLAIGLCTWQQGNGIPPKSAKRSRARGGAALGAEGATNKGDSLGLTATSSDLSVKRLPQPLKSEINRLDSSTGHRII